MVSIEFIWCKYDEAHSIACQEFYCGIRRVNIGSNRLVYRAIGQVACFDPITHFAYLCVCCGDDVAIKIGGSSICGKHTVVEDGGVVRMPRQKYCFTRRILLKNIVCLLPHARGPD